MTDLCPQCDQAGRKLSRETLRAQLITPVETYEGWLLCRDRGCPIVYYGPTGSARAEAVRALPYSLNTEADPMVCFCFNHRVSDLRTDLATNARSTIQAAIKAACRAGRDDCPRKNPKGSCCLGDVASVLREVEPQRPAETGGGGCCGGDHPVEATPDAPTESAAGCSAVAHTASAPSAPAIGRARWATGGAIIAAVLSSACCWLPLLLLATGASAAGLGAWFEAWRLPLLGLTVILLGAAFYFAYRPEKACSDGSCATPNRTLQRLNRSMLWLSTALVLGFATFPSYVSMLLGESQAKPITVGGETTVHPVKGMSCEGCSVHINEVLQALPDVEAAQADYPSKTVRIQWRQAPNLAAAQAAATEIGYTIGAPVAPGSPR